MNQINEARIADALRFASVATAEQAVLADAAQEHRRCVRDWITCPTCGGTELLDAKSYEIPGVCPDCVDGMTPSPELVERVAAALWDADDAYTEPWGEFKDHNDWYRRMAKVGLLASRREGEA